MNHIPLVEVTRGDIVESIHYGSISIAFRESEKTISIGEHAFPFFLRSSAKPFQALAFLERGGAAFFGLTQEEIAIICASHSGTDKHVDVLAKLHKKIGLTEDMLLCGTHIPYDRETAERMIKEGEPLRPYRSDCSGKHSGMLSFAKMIKASTDNYLDLDHPVQKHILKTFAKMCGVRLDTITLGIDGCSAPVFAIPLPNAARGFAALCQPDHLPAERSEACKLITTSMSRHPEMVAGPKRFDTDFMHTANGKAISKIGAEGYLAISVFPHANPHRNGSIGITIKIADGDGGLRAGCTAGLAVLDQLGILSADELRKLKEYYIRPVKNWQKDDIGLVRPARKLIEALERALP